jgi:hypothetical protein
MLKKISGTGGLSTEVHGPTRRLAALSNAQFVSFAVVPSRGFGPKGCSFRGWHS